MCTRGFRVGCVSEPNNSRSVDGIVHWDQCFGCHVEQRRRHLPSACFEPSDPCLFVMQDWVARVLGHGASGQLRIALGIGGIAVQILGVVGHCGSTWRPPRPYDVEVGVQVVMGAGCSGS